MAIDDSTSKNGCLKFIKGSHKDKKLKKHKINKSEKLTLNQELLKSEYIEKNSVDLVLKRGQISLHDVYMVHGSEENKSPKSRRAMTMRFMPTTSIFDHRFVFNTRDFSITKIYQARGKDVSMKNNIIPLDTMST